MRELIEKLTSAGWIAGVLRGHRPPVSELEQRTALFR